MTSAPGAATLSAMATIELPASGADYHTRPLRRTEAGAVMELIAAYERRVLGEVLIELVDIEADWQPPGADLERRTVGVFDPDGTIPVGVGEVGLDDRAEACIHPDHWGRGLGTAVARWTRAVAREHGLARIGQTVPDGDLGAQKLFAGEGYERRHTSWVLAMPADRRVAPVALPDGYAIVDFGPGRDEHAAYQVIEDAFNEWPDRVPRAYDAWSARVLRRPGFEPWQLRLVRGPGERVVGACLLQLGDDTGWVEQIAVERAHRRRGLAQALLSDAFATARARGRERAVLSTDSRTGALALYEHVGMVVTSSFTHWSIAL